MMIARGKNACNIIFTVVFCHSLKSVSFRFFDNSISPVNKMCHWFFGLTTVYTGANDSEFVMNKERFGPGSVFMFTQKM